MNGNTGHMSGQDTAQCKRNTTSIYKLEVWYSGAFIDIIIIINYIL